MWTNALLTLKCCWGCGQMYSPIETVHAREILDFAGKSPKESRTKLF
jgi:hypothetical protein